MFDTFRLNFYAVYYQVRSTLEEMYFKHLDMISRYRLFLQEVSDNLHSLHTKRPGRIKS